MPLPVLDICVAFDGQERLSGRVESTDPSAPTRRVEVFDDPVARTVTVRSVHMSEAEVVAIKAATFDLVGYHGVFEWTKPGEVSPRLWCFDEFSPTKRTAQDCALALTLREALGS